jgi:hypothetical protein
VSRCSREVKALLIFAAALLVFARRAGLRLHAHEGRPAG